MKRAQVALLFWLVSAGKVIAVVWIIHGWPWGLLACAAALALAGWDLER